MRCHECEREVGGLQPRGIVVINIDLNFDQKVYCSWECLCFAAGDRHQSRTGEDLFLRDRITSHDRKEERND